MYESFFGFKQKPFGLVPDPAFLYFSKKHRQAYAMLEYGVTSGSPITVITGEIGAGKTTLLQHLLNQLGDTVQVGLITNTHKSFGDVMQWVNMAFGLPYSRKSKPDLYQGFVDNVVKNYAAGRRTILAVDEAQNLSSPVLEELRVLSNINMNAHNVLQLILIGQPQLRSILAQPDLAQMAQRVASTYHLGSLSEAETIGYIAHRVTVAGGDPLLFDASASIEIYKASMGTPRIINRYCDLALVYAYADQARGIDAQLVTQVVAEQPVFGG